jgi:hypothetical protein
MMIDLQEMDRNIKRSLRFVENELRVFNQCVLPGFDFERVDYLLGLLDELQEYWGSVVYSARDGFN